MTKRSYTIIFKLDVISYVEKTSNCRASIYYKVDRKRVQEWRKQKESFETIKNDKDLIANQIQILNDCGQKAVLPMLEKELLEYIKRRREEKGTVTTSMIIKKAKDLGKDQDLKGIKFSRGWTERFKQRHKLVKRI